MREREREHGPCQGGVFDVANAQTRTDDDEPQTRAATGSGESATEPTPPTAMDPRAARLDAAHLTTAQREVLEARRRGVSYARIAKMRGTATSTVRDIEKRAKRRAAGDARRMTSGAPWLRTAAARASRDGRRLDARILKALASGATIRDAARLVRVTEGTVRGRVRTEWLRAERLQTLARARGGQDGRRS